MIPAMSDKRDGRVRRAAVAMTLSLLLAACASTAPSAGEADSAGGSPGEATASPYIVQGTDLAAVIAAVEGVGATVTHELAIIRAVGARLTAAQRAALAEHPAVTRIYEDRKVGIDAES